MSISEQKEKPCYKKKERKKVQWKMGEETALVLYGTKFNLGTPTLISSMWS